MTQDQIIEMARQAGFVEYELDDGTTNAFDKRYEIFAKLVEDKVTARYMQLFLDPENQPTQFGTATQEYREQEIKDEREACAKVCDGMVLYTGHDCAEAIRARGQQ